MLDINWLKQCVNEEQGAFELIKEDFLPDGSTRVTLVEIIHDGENVEATYTFDFNKAGVLVNHDCTFKPLQSN